MANIPVNNNAQLLVSSQSITGSFSGFTVLPSSSLNPHAQAADFTGLKDGQGANLISGSNLLVLTGTTIWMTITSASLNTNSANVLLYR